MRTTKLNVRRLVFLVVIVVVVVRIGSRIGGGVNDDEEIEKRTSDGEGFTENYEDLDEGNSGETEDSFNGYSFGEDKIETEIDYEFDEKKKSALGENRVVIKSNTSSEEKDYRNSHGDEDVGDNGSLGEWSMNSGAEEKDDQSSFSSNTTQNVTAVADINIIANKTDVIHSGSTPNITDIDESIYESDGANVFLDDVDVINEDGKIIKDTSQGEHADGFVRGVTIATAEQNDAIRPQHTPDTEQEGEVAQEDLVNELQNDIKEQDRGEMQNGGVIEEKNVSNSEIKLNKKEQSNNDVDQQPPVEKSVMAENTNENLYPATRQPFIKRRVSGEEDIEEENEVDDENDENKH